LILGNTTLTNNEADSAQALNGIKILDLSGPSGYYCTKLLADLGAEVVMIENKSDEIHTTLGPFYKNKRIPNNSLYRWHYHTNKKSVELDINSQTDRKTIDRMIQICDVIVETFTDTESEKLNLTSNNIRQLNENIVHTKIRGFNSSGPYKNYEAPDIIALAMSGLMAITGFPEDPPNQMGAEQAFHMGSMNAAVGTMISILERDINGIGRDVTVSLQECASMATLQTANLNYYTWHGINRGRTGLNHPFSDQQPSYDLNRKFPRVLYPCTDGWVAHAAHLAPPTAWSDFVKWLSDYDSQQDLADNQYNDPEIRHGKQPHINDVMLSHCSKLTMQELYHSAQRYRILVQPVSSVKDLTEDEQLQYRKFFVELNHSEIGKNISYPGAPYKLSETPWKLKSKSPQIGENTKEILKKWLNTEINQKNTTE